ncbi:MAG: Unknown protein [uncultured Sulfurovum sp.]|uniref:Peptidoglycan binding-like domain-containing protein n=1 Tax=uncultured Sulfurovum sp. TaxID=269237 RepID=A0A6S6S324_9BACT|nr:MAG: Unknown protein [uncultured Sulfurovum sp.]
MKQVEANRTFQALSIGKCGTMVYVTQKILNTMHYDLKEDGIFSSQMEEAVKSFQDSRTTLVVDGVVGYETMKEMDDVSSML